MFSHDTLCTPEFLAAVEAFDCARLLIADEAHNLGRPSFINDPPEFFEYRLGLSATPIRQYDEEGTEALFGFFGPVAFRFTLEEAIGSCLVEYDYYVHPVYLTETEMSEWFDLTGKIKQNAWRSNGGKRTNTSPSCCVTGVSCWKRRWARFPCCASCSMTKTRAVCGTPWFTPPTRDPNSSTT